jgi:hypothetical protein
MSVHPTSVPDARVFSSTTLQQSTAAWWPFRRQTGLMPSPELGIGATGIASARHVSGKVAKRSHNKAFVGECQRLRYQAVSETLLHSSLLVRSCRWELARRPETSEFALLPCSTSLSMIRLPKRVAVLCFAVAISSQGCQGACQNESSTGVIINGPQILLFGHAVLLKISRSPPDDRC